MPYYRGFEDVIWGRVCERFGLGIDLPTTVHQADLIALATERRDLMPPDPVPWDFLVGIEPAPERIRPWSPTEARKRSMNPTFKALSLSRMLCSRFLSGARPP